MIIIEKRVVIIGATSGIGRALALMYAQSGARLGLAGRREECLKTLQDSIGDKAVIQTMDLSVPDAAITLLEQLISRLGGMDLIIISSGVGHINPDLNWQMEQETVSVNVTGFIAMARTAIKYFETQGSGQLVGLTSIAAIRGNGGAPAYGASKAFVSHYLEALRCRHHMNNSHIIVTEIQLGFVDTKMAQGEGLFWVAPVEKAAWQMLRVIEKKRKHAYITRRWRLVAWIVRLLPESVLRKMS